MILKQEKIRCSNIELLRIVAMLFIMLGHTYLRIHQMSNLLDVMLSCISTTGVGIFIAISGWFGIRFKKKGVAKYLFQVLFILWVVYGIVISLNIAPFDLEGIKISLSFYEGYWFIMGYLGLYIFSPILNTFIDNASKNEYQIVLLSYFLFQSYFSWLSAWYDYYGGYSIVLFGGIYLSAAYLRKYPVRWIHDNAPSLLVGTIFLMSLIAYVSISELGHAARQIRDDNPLVIMTSILMVICFNKFKFQSVFVNWLAASCFAVYLIHFNPFVYPYFMQLMHFIYTHYDGVGYVFMLLFALSLVYIVCTLFDQIRILAWNCLNTLSYKFYREELRSK